MRCENDRNVSGFQDMTESDAAPAEAGAYRRTRFFQIGFPRCGTSSIAAFFNRCGIPCVHHDRARLARRMRANLEAGARPLEGYDHRYLAFTDMDLNTADDYFDAFKHYAALHRAYSGKFILNTRPRERWVRSIMMHKARWGRRKLLQHYDLRFGTMDLDRVAELWREEWEEHHRRVREEIPAGILLEFDIESDPPERLCDFAGVPHSCARFYTHENATMNRFGRFLGASVPLAVKHRIPAGLKGPLKNLLRLR